MDSKNLSVRLYLNVGKQEDLNADQIRDFLTDGLDIAASEIGSVALRKTHCYVRVPELKAEEIIKNANGKTVGEREVVIEKARR